MVYEIALDYAWEVTKKRVKNFDEMEFQFALLLILVEKTDKFLSKRWLIQNCKVF